MGVPPWPWKPPYGKTFFFVFQTSKAPVFFSAHGSVENMRARGMIDDCLDSRGLRRQDPLLPVFDGECPNFSPFSWWFNREKPG